MEGAPEFQIRGGAAGAGANTNTPLPGEGVEDDNKPQLSPHAATAVGGNEIFHVEFHGTALEYFRIWFVNTLLTIITVGIYSAWAKVRNNRYFYGSTWLAGANFEYHARPMQILVARLFVFAVIGGGAYWAGEDVIRNAYWTLILGLFLPWALVRGLSFNARNSSWASARLSFVRGYVALYLVFAPALIFYAISAFNVSLGGLFPVPELNIILGIATLLLVFVVPLMLRAYHRYKAGRHRLGKLRFEMAPVSRVSYYGALFLPYVLGIMFTALVFFSIMIFVVQPELDSLQADGKEMADTVYFQVFSLIGVLSLFLSILFIGIVVQTALFRIFWQNLRASNGARFVCNVKLWAFSRMLLVNFLATVLSLGLLHPWAKVRKTRYLAHNIRLIVPAGEMTKLTSPGGEMESALGEEMDAAEGFDFDIALV